MMKNRPGFTLVEVIIAMLILAVGVLAMAATTGYLSRQIRQADLRTERAAATRTATERMRGIPYADLEDRPQSDAWEIGDYDIFWDVVEDGTLKQMTIMSIGPGLTASGDVTMTAVDTTKFSIAKSTWR